MNSLSEEIEELQKLLEIGIQYWFLGAGASVASNIPLMYSLTERVKVCLDEEAKTVFTGITADLTTGCHVEHVLSHIGDLLAISERSRSKTATAGGTSFSSQTLKTAHRAIVEAIAKTVRYGYCTNNGTDPEVIGSLENPIVDITAHRNFIRQIFNGRSNLEGRSRVSFFTTNYDTLIEDALALERRIAVDGFTGTAIAFWKGFGAGPDTQGAPYHQVLKLHGSVDWFKDPTHGLLRVRYGVKYLAELDNTLIYPQATKYVETQKDPFAHLFDAFRRSLRIEEGHVLAIVGYSFGDEHINTEIESALRERKNRTNIIAFSKEIPDPEDESQTVLCETLERWRNSQEFGSRIFIGSDKALYCGSRRILGGPQPLKWWKFDGLTTFLKQGTAT